MDINTGTDPNFKRPYPKGTTRNGEMPNPDEVAMTGQDASPMGVIPLDAIQQPVTQAPMGLPPMRGAVPPQAEGTMIGEAAPQLNVADILDSISSPTKKKEVSLSTLSSKQVDKIMKAIERGEQLANHYYKNTIEPTITKRTQIYNSDADMYKKKFPRLTERTAWRSRDVQVASEWILPGLMEAFVGGSKPVDVKGVDVNDDLKAKKIEEIVAYQVERKNSLHALMQYSLEEGLRSNFGIAKVYWKHDEEREERKTLVSMQDVDAGLVLMQQATTGEIEIKRTKALPDAPDLLEVVYDKIKVINNYPVIDYVPPYEIRFTPEGKTFQDTKYVAHRKVVTGDYLKRKEKEGTFKNIDKAMKDCKPIVPPSLESLMRKDANQARYELQDDDDASKYVELMEAYIDVDYNNDGIMEKLIVHYVGKTPVQIQENDFGFVPFYPCCIYYNPSKIFDDRSYEELIEQQQDLKTALVKQMIINIAQQNAGQRVVNADVIDVNGMLDGDEIVMATGADKPLGHYVYAMETPQLAPYTMDLLNYAQSEVESQTGSTKYNQGLDSNSLNKTASGISMIMSASDKRAKMIARNIAEHFYIPLIKAVIALNQKYLQDGQIIRLNNENVPIRKEDLDIDYDLIINVGEGAGTKEIRIQYLMILINQLIPLLVQSGIADENTIYDTAKELLQEMGLRSSVAVLTDPKSPEASVKARQKAQEQQQAVVMAQQEADKARQTELLKALMPRISIKYEDLPMESRSTLLQTLGLLGENSVAEVIAKEMLDNAKADSKEQIQAEKNIKNLESINNKASGNTGTNKKGTAKQDNK